MRLEEYDAKIQELIREAMKTDSSAAKFEDLDLSYLSDHEKAFKIEVPMRGLLHEDGTRTHLVEVRPYFETNDDFFV